MTEKKKKDFKILGIENRIEQILANLLDNAISFSKDKQKIIVEVEKNQIKGTTQRIGGLLLDEYVTEKSDLSDNRKTLR